MKFTYHLLDVFTEEKFGGNPLAIFPNAHGIPESQFQRIAAELNLSETVFLFPEEGDPSCAMRIFTPGMELPTAGHPTIGTAHFLARQTPATSQTHKIMLDQKIGRITVEVQLKNNHPDLITMYQPLPTFGTTYEHRDAFARLLSLEAKDLLDAPIQEVSCGNNFIFIPVRSTSALGKIRVRTELWEDLKPSLNTAFLYIFTTGNVVNGDVQGRMFAPDAGIPEDPATGSANGPLICYLDKYGLVTAPILSLQGYEMGRSSQLHLDLAKNAAGEITAVKVGGRCVPIGEGVLFLDTE